MSMPDLRLIATDLDGTLLRDDKTVNAFTASVIMACEERGIPFVPVTARQPKGITAIAEQAGLTGWAIACNGGFGYHLSTGEVAFSHALESGAMADLAHRLREVRPSVRFAAVGLPGTNFRTEPGYREIADPTDHHPAMQHCDLVDLDELVAAPALKLICRDPEIAPRELLAIVDGLGEHGVHATHSGANFLEMAPAGVTKATGVAELCAHLGIDASEVAAFGDAPNDVEMLRWAGRSWAMPLSEDHVKAAAKSVARSNNDDGVARVVIELLRP